MTETTCPIHYLEIVTPDVDAACAAYTAALGVTFDAPNAALGQARVARLSDETRLGIRAPLRADELPVVRNYVRVERLGDAVRAAEEAGAHVHVREMELPGEGTIAIVSIGGVEQGFWQLP